jgi:hypothetical protein
VVENIKRYDNKAGAWETASWFLGVPAGMGLPIRAEEAYFIYMGKEMNNLWKVKGKRRGAGSPADSSQRNDGR